MEHNRETDEFKDIDLCNATPEERDRYLQGIAQRGAFEALRSIGLSDDAARTDIQDIRDMLKGFRVIRKTAWTTALAAAGRVVGWILVFSIGSLFLHSTAAKHIASFVTE